MSNYEEIQSALSYVDSRDRDTWFEVGAALKDELGEEGFTLWDNWSQTAENYNARDAKSVWKSIKPGHIRIGSLFHFARANGYTPSKPYVPPTPEEQARRAAEAQARQQAEELERKQKQAAAKATAQSIWNRSRPADPKHPYLAAKGITDTQSIAGLRQNHYQGNVNLLVPLMYDREIVNIQSINQDGSKRFLAGGQVKGAYSVVGDATQTDKGVVIAEGFATAASIYQATGKPVIVAFNAGNMVTVAERLAQTLPPDVPVTIAVDNDASQTGITKAIQAAAHFGERAQAIEPQFTMTQIQQYQREKGLDADGNPQLPSDFNDLHHLAGIEAVRDQMSAGIRVPEHKEHTMALPTKTEFNGPDFIRELKRELDKNFHTPQENFIDSQAFMKDGSYLRADNERLGLSLTANAQEDKSVKVEFARMQGDYSREYSVLIDGHEQSPAQLLADLTKVARTWEQERGSFQKNEQQERIETNSIEFDDTRQTQEPPKPQTVSEPERAAAPIKPETNPEKAVEPKAPETAAGVKKPILDLNYTIPPESIKSRYIVADGQYLSAENGTTVLFEDTGKKISTAKVDAQTINDMLEVAKAKGWDSIKLNGSKEFKQMMYVAAESQGISTKGYSPTAADLALVERLRQDKSLNSIESAKTQRPDIQTPVTPAKEQSLPEVERIVAHGAAPYRHDPKQPNNSYYLTLEKDGRERTVWGVGLSDALVKSGADVGDSIRLQSLGKQPVEIEVPVRDSSGRVVGHESQKTHRNVFDIDVVERKQEPGIEPNAGNTPGQEQDKKIPTQPDVAAISASEKMMAQGHLPSQSQINVSERADTDPHVPIQSIGGNVLNPEVKHNAEALKASALDTGYVSAKQNYMDKAAKLSKPDRARLEFYERHTLDTLRGAKDDVRTEAMRNYYEHTAKLMNGSKLDLPKPVQIPTHTAAVNPGRSDQLQSQQPVYNPEHEPEPEYGR